MKLIRMGKVPFDYCLSEQRAIHEQMKASQWPQHHLILCSHDPVYTIGKSGRANLSLRVGIDELTALGLELQQVERGGDITYHGPEQLVAYPLLNLNFLRRDVGWYVRSLEEVILTLLTSYDVQAHRVQGRPGVWTTNNRKIASVGVKLSRWCTFHGIALNIFDCSYYFKLINPCGMPEVEVTSLAELSSREIVWEDVASRFVQAFADVFKIVIRD